MTEPDKTPALPDQEPLPRRKKLNLALQGGGAHGAFTWGVVDALLEDERIELEGVSGTSAGAMNATVLVQGHSKGGRTGARAALDEFWHRIAQLSWMSPVHRTFYDRLMGNWNTDNSPGFMAIEALANSISPYQLNPVNFHPLRGILEDMVDFEAVSACHDLKLFISTTNAATGQNRVFMKHDVTVDAILASACLPNLFQAIEIDGEPYWDGGYTGNPSIWPIIYNCDCRDVAVVQINPLLRPGTPRTAQEIFNRLNEVTFNFSLIAEMRAIAFVQRLIDDDHLKGQIVDRLKKIHVHLIGDERDMLELGVSSKYNTDLEFLLHLKELGRASAQKWLAENFAKIGRHSSVDIRTKFLEER